MNTRSWIASSLLLLTVVGTALGLAAWKKASIRESEATAASQPEPMEVVAAANAVKREHVRTTTAIGTVLALRSITLRNELPGTVHEVRLEPGAIVEAGQVLVALDVSVEEAELRALEAQAELARTSLGRMQRASKNRGASEMDVDRASAELAVADANIERTKAIIARKTIRAPFPARVGMADVHPGQFLNEGTELTTLQGVDEAVHVDFTVGQQVARGLQVGDHVDVVASADSTPITAKIVALDARVDRTTRNAMVRARIEGVERMPTPGASVRVRVPVGEPRDVVAVPVSALRKGPQGDHVFVITTDAEGKTRAHVRLVQSGAMVGDEILIYDGLTAGEQVAASGSFKLREGVLVAIAAEPEPDAAMAR